MSGDRWWWYLARSSGLLAWALLTVSVATGALLAARSVRRTRFEQVTAAHRLATSAGLWLTVGHLVALLIDDYIEFAPHHFVVPFTSPWRPGAVAWGVGALWLAMVVQVSSLAAHRMSRRTWHRLHRLAIPAWAAASVHLVQAGTEARRPAPFTLVAALIGATTFVVLSRTFRLFRRRRDPLLAPTDADTEAPDASPAWSALSPNPEGRAG